ncbi:nuclear matrix constituent protein 1-like, partial [Trifolium pratense]
MITLRSNAPHDLTTLTKPNARNARPVRMHGNKSALAESTKREECFKRTIGIKDAYIGSLEKALREMRTECAETKVAADNMLVEAYQLIDEAQEKFMQAEAKVCAAESLRADANRYNS